MARATAHRASLNIGLDSNKWLNCSLIYIYLTGTKRSYPNMTCGFVHIDDVVKCHILAMEDKRASGRLICSGPVVHWSEIVKMLKSKYSKYPITDRCGSNLGYADQHSLDTSKLSELGFPAFTSIEHMFDDCIASFQEKGLLQ
ncbi:tetraketide alpha-pyrone reductase 2 [Carex littledalei]|uniref:Tetraketide alpha-pyrone reductase 2 n=1 Tax=Carex littledalei TaxID=544730 RepID=A0A833V4N2_9POAL|nr:tetraketide alpha-pyrone reductase 2 [Carex littledalei]